MTAAGTSNTCIDCGEVFLVREEEAAWRVRCVACYVRLRNTPRGGYWRLAEASQEGRVARLRSENAKLRGEVSRLRAALAERELSPAMVKLLLQVAHPDKHGGSALSRRATKYLLKLREGKHATNRG